MCCNSMNIFRKTLLFIIFAIILSSCQTTSTEIDSSEVNVNLANLNVVGDWKHQGQIKALGNEFDKEWVIRSTHNAISKNLSTLSGSIPLNIDVSVEQYFIQNKTSSFLLSPLTGSTAPSQHMVGRVNISDARSGNFIKENMLINIQIASPDFFAQEVKKKVLQQTRNL